MKVKFFFFKLLVTLWLIVKTMLFVTPVVLVIVLAKEGAWKYGFDYIEPSYNVALFVGFAISFMVVAYHALSFEMNGSGPLLHFLKTSQKGYFNTTMSLDEMKDKLATRKYFVKIESSDHGITCRRNVRFMPKDHIYISKNEEGVWEVDSHPFKKWWYLDFGRNLKNVNEIKALLSA